MQLTAVHCSCPLPLPLPRPQVNATGVMPVIFASSLLALPSSLARYANVPALDGVATALSPSGGLYLPANVALIVAFNYLYTFLQLDPKDLSEQLKRQGASIPGIRPGRATAEYITKTLDRMSVLGEQRGARRCSKPCGSKPCGGWMEPGKVVPSVCCGCFAPLLYCLLQLRLLPH